jgi:hypothetical protein
VKTNHALPVSDREAIIEVTTGVLWHADRREWNRISAAFDDRVILDYTSLNGGEPAQVTPEQIVHGWREALGRFASTQHLVASHLVRIDGASATATAQFIATHITGGEGTVDNRWTLAGHYRWELVKRSEQWRIATMAMTATWSSGTPHA